MHDGRLLTLLNLTAFSGHARLEKALHGIAPGGVQHHATVLFKSLATQHLREKVRWVRLGRDVLHSGFTATTPSPRSSLILKSLRSTCLELAAEVNLWHKS